MSHDQIRTYEGRSLARQEEEVVDQGLAFDLGTLVSRRQALRALSVGAAAVGLAACGSGSTSSSATASAAASATAGASPPKAFP